MRNINITNNLKGGLLLFWVKYTVYLILILSARLFVYQETYTFLCQKYAVFLYCTLLYLEEFVDLFYLSLLSIFCPSLVGNYHVHRIFHLPNNNDTSACAPCIYGIYIRRDVEGLKSRLKPNPDLFRAS